VTTHAKGSIFDGYLGPGPNTTQPAVNDSSTGQPCGEITVEMPNVSGGCMVENVRFGYFAYKTSHPCFQPGGIPGGSEFELGELHVASDGTFAAEDIYASCGFYGAQRCDVQPEDYLYYFPEKQAKNVLRSQPWTGAFFKGADGAHYAYMSLCLSVMKVGPEAKWTDYIVAKVHEAEIEGETHYEWEFVTSASMPWLEGQGFYADYIEQGPGAVIDWN
jgi:hypothetical protein